MGSNLDAGTKRNVRARVAIVAIGAAMALLVASHVATATVVHGPVISEDAADPKVILDGNRFFAFTTNSLRRGNVPVWESTDLTAWSYVGDALPSVGAWAVRGATWSTTVTHRGFMKWVLFYTAIDRASGDHCIGRATASSASGPYRDDNAAPVVCQLDHGGSIDPDVYIDGAGALWLVWKSDDIAIDGWDQIWSAQLDATASHFVSPPGVLITVDPNEDGSQVEAPQLVGAGGQLWLFYSAGDWDTSDYAVHVVRCLGPAGPCPKDNPTPPWLDTSAGVAGPGSISLVSDGAGAWFAAFHGWVGAVGYENGGSRGMFIEPVTFGPGTPTLRPDLSRHGQAGVVPDL
ncbi:MAG TPA: glycoside hydrolase family 43 protein [Acidimicrobiales bacterium]|nr:glycoside hydrolase family 43 protein [Acidimicrobiales bacterium]